MSGCVQYEQNSEMMVIAKIHVWKVPVLLYGDFADRVLIYIHGQDGRKEEAESFAEIATNYDWQVISADLPEHGEKRIRQDLYLGKLYQSYRKVIWQLPILNCLQTALDLGQ